MQPQTYGSCTQQFSGSRFFSAPCAIISRKNSGPRDMCHPCSRQQDRGEENKCDVTVQHGERQELL
jgi:hypothetical protein